MAVLLSGNGDSDEGDVITRNALRPLVYFSPERPAYFVGRQGLSRDSLDSGLTIFFAVLIGLKHAVGVEKEAIARSKRQHPCLMAGKLRDPEYQAILHDIIDRLVGGAVV